MMISDRGNKIAGIKTEVWVYKVGKHEAIGYPSGYKVYIELKAKKGTLPRNVAPSYRCDLNDLSSKLATIYNNIFHDRRNELIKTLKTLNQDREKIDQELWSNRNHTQELEEELRDIELSIDRVERELLDTSWGG